MTMRKIYTLGTCATCKRILSELNLDAEFEIQDVKKTKLTEDQLQHLVTRIGGYKELINTQSRKAKSMELSKKTLSDQEYKQLLLDEYTLLKRPLIIDGDHCFLGNSKKTIEDAKAHFNN